MEIIDVRFDQENVYIVDKDGTQKSLPLAWFPRLAKASQAQRNNYEFSPFGIHWPDIDEDLSFEGFIKFQKDMVRVTS